MAFATPPTVKQIADGLVRLSGGIINAGQAGEIGLFGSGAEVELPEGFMPTTFSRYGVAVTLQDMVRVQLNQTNDDAYVENISVEKTGTVVADFLITITNHESTEGDDVTLEIYIEYKRG